MLACFSCLSYSDESKAQSSTSVVYGISPNAANPAMNWVMTNVLPQQAGLTVGTVIYQYDTIKETEDDMLVHVQNEDAQGDGYIFRETDDWSGLPSNRIRKIVPVGGIPINRWGDGSIEVEGTGIVADASVVYTYQYDPCFDPQTNPECPGYKPPYVEIEEPEPYDALDEQYVQDELDRKAVMKDEDQEDTDRRKVESKKEIKENLEKLLGTTNTTDLAQGSNIMHANLTILNFMPTSYYETIPGGEYVESVQLTDSELPDNSAGRRQQFAQDLLHDKLVDLQYVNDKTTGKK